MSMFDDVFVGILWVSLLVQVPAEVISRPDKGMIVRIVECKPLEGSSKKDVAWKKDAESQVTNVGVPARCQGMCSQSGRGMKRWGIEELQCVLSCGWSWRVSSQDVCVLVWLLSCVPG